MTSAESTTRAAAQALGHLRILDLSRVLAGPWATQILADLGAEVIKVERPGSGDDTRGWGPPWLEDEDGQATGESAYFASANRNKKSLAVDLRHPRGQELIRTLVAHCDVVVENFKVGTLARWGLDHEALSAIKPGLVTCSITGFGQDGPYANRPGYDFMIQAMGGLMSVTGAVDGEPMKTGVALADVMTGLYATIGILAALTHRDRTGEGQHIDLALLDVQVATMANQAMNYLTSGVAPVRLGNAHPNIVPYQVFATVDGSLVLAVGNDAQFKRFCAKAGLEGLAEDAKYATNAARVRNRAELVPLLAAAIARKSLDWWVEALEQEGIPGGPVNTLDRVFNDPQVRHRGLHRTLPHPSAGTVPSVASPLNLSATPPSYQTAPPLLGQHSREVLTEICGIEAEQIAELEAAGIIPAPDGHPLSRHHDAKTHRGAVEALCRRADGGVAAHR